jgi:hypothetical protein
MKANRATSACASIEMLESRCLLSAVPVSLRAAMAAAPAAVHTHPSPPNIVNSYSGTYAATNGTTGQLTITISSEGKTGKIAGTLTVAGSGTINISGAVNVKGKFSLHGSAGHHTITATGSVSSDLATLAGKFVSTGRHGATRGTFSTVI